jgi:2'-5' RNA ligase
MQTIRSFIAIPVSPGVQSAAKRLINEFKSVDSGIKWVPTENLHLTLKFLGDVDNTEVHEVCKTIRSATAAIDPFELHFRGAGGFPNLEKPRVIYAGVDDPTGQLVQLVADLETRLAGMGFKPEPRDYTPHLTLGRKRGSGGRPDPALIDSIESYSDFELGELVVEEVLLMASFLDKSGPTYQVMDTIEL